MQDLATWFDLIRTTAAAARHRVHRDHHPQRLPGRRGPVRQHRHGEHGYNAVEVALSSSSANLKRCLAICHGTGSLRLGAPNTSSGTCSYSSPL